MKQDVNACIDIIAKAGEGEITPDQAKSLVNQIMNEINRQNGRLDNAEARIKEIGNKLINEDKMLSALQRRNALLTVLAQDRVKNYVKKFPSTGDGLLAFMNGTSKKMKEGRLSVYYQGQAIKDKYVGQLVDQLEKANLIREFKSGELDEQIFKEMWEASSEGGKPGISGSPKAQAIAKIVNDLQLSMIDRENRAGAFIHKLDGYIMRQAHDADAIRRAGGLGYGIGSSNASFKVWSEFIAPLLDHEKTFDGITDKAQFLKGAHEGILSGIHNKPGIDHGDINSDFRATGAMARKVSASRVLHFKDADSAYKYNQRFGNKEFRETVVRQIQLRAKGISMMENFGPNPERTFNAIVHELKNEAKKAPDDIRQLKELSNWKVEASFRELMGFNDAPNNPSLSRIMNSIRAIGNLSKLGGSTITSIADKGFLQSEMSFQGINSMDTVAKQFTLLAEGRADGEKKSMLNLMGAGLDGFIGNVVNRFSMHDNKAGMLFRLQQKFFDLNGMNWWNDIHKGAAAELMSHHLASHSNLEHSKLPKKLADVLELYGIGKEEWDIVRASTMDLNGRSYIAPDGLMKLPDEAFKPILDKLEIKYTDTSIQRIRDRLDTQLRTYFADRTDIAVPTPGNEEKVYAHWNTQAGTPLGEAVRMLMMFKSMPITVFQKVIKRELYGHGSDTMMQWLRNDRLGNFRMINLIAMATLGGYVSGVIKDALKGRTPKELTPKTIQDAMLRGGGLGIYGDFLFNEYDRSYRSFLATTAGPVVGQLDTIADIADKLKKGEPAGKEAGKLLLNNTPFTNLFYIRPVLDYFILWNLQEMADPGSLRRQERKVERDNGQGFFIRPSEQVNK
jgi:hypothetical protein